MWYLYHVNNVLLIVAGAYTKSHFWGPNYVVINSYNKVLVLKDSDVEQPAAVYMYM